MRKMFYIHITKRAARKEGSEMDECYVWSDWRERRKERQRESECN